MPAVLIEDGGYDQRGLWTEESWQWKTITKRTQPKFWDDDRWKQADYPAVGMVWFEAVAYCHWAGARLPTKVEWERPAGWDVGKQGKYIYPCQ